MGRIILIIGPCRSGVPVLLDGVAKVRLRDIICERDVVDLEPSFELVCIPGVVCRLAGDGLGCHIIFGRDDR